MTRYTAGHELPTCHFCGNTQAITTSTGRQLNTLLSTSHWTGTDYIRVHVCNDHASRITKAPCRPRTPRASVVPATDWNMLVMATKRRARAS